MNRAVLPYCVFAASLAFCNSAAAQQTAPDSGVATLRSTSRIVVVDVVVHDAKGNPAHGLKAEEFTLREKGEPQKLLHFEEHRQPTAEEIARLPAPPKLPPGVFTNLSQAPSGGALNILLLDTLNTPVKDQMYMRKKMLDYLKSPRLGARMAIFGLGSQLYMLQGFTSDPEVLRKVLGSKAAGNQASAMMDNSANGDLLGANDPMQDLIDQKGLDPDQAAMADAMKNFEAEQQTSLIVDRAAATLEAFNELGHYLGTLPGRKNLIWFSGSFPINILPDPTLPNPYVVEASMVGAFETTVNLLSRAQVSVYPVDARGLMVAPMLDASTNGSHLSQLNPKNMVGDQQKFFGDTAAENATMLDMAHETGGRAFINSNALDQAVLESIDDGSNYYSLTYTPSNKDWKGEYRKIQVDLERKGYTLSYRRGYFADDESRIKARQAAAAKSPAFNPITAAMKLGVPPLTEILFSTQVLPVSTQSEPNPAPGNHPEADTKGPFRRYSVLFSADPRGINTTPGLNNTRHIDIRFIALLYDSQGKLINSVGQHVEADMPADRFAAMQKTGSRYKLEMSVPVKGSYFFRLGVADLSTQKVGVVELPVASVARLPPAPAKP